MNQVANLRAAGALAALGNLKKGIENVTSTLKVSSGGEYLRLTKSGKWVFGQAATKIDPKTKWAFDVPSLEHGWTCWERGDDADTRSKGPLGEVMVSLFTPLPPEGSLKDYGYEWVQQISVKLTGVGGEDNGKQVVYKVNSKGGVARMKELLNKITAEATPEAPVPLIQFSNDSYNHKRWGETLVPIFTIVGWTDLDGTSLPDDDDEEEVVEVASADVEETVQEDVDEEEAKLLAQIQARRDAKVAAAKQATAAPAEAGAPVRRRNAR